MSDGGSCLLLQFTDHQAMTSSSSLSDPKPSQSFPATTHDDQTVLSMNGITCRFNEVIAN